MGVPFSQGSSVEAMRISWDMWYHWIPPYQHYEKEPGVHIHLSPADAGAIASSISAGAAAVGASLGPVFSALAAIVANIVSHLVLNRDGSMDIYMSRHGFQAGNAPAADPNVWINGLWGPVAVALDALGGFARMDAMVATRPDPRTSSGKLLAAEPMELPS